MRHKDTELMRRMQHFLQHDLGEPMEHKEKCSISASFLCKMVHIEAFGENRKRVGMSR